MIHIKDLSLFYPGQESPALKPLNLHIRSNEFVLICGPSGSGKSTLMQCLNGIMHHATNAIVEGRVTLNGVDVGDYSLQNICKVAGSVFQNPAVQLCSSMVETEVAFGLENLNFPRKVMTSRVRRALQLTGLEGMSRQKVNTLSGGQQQRLVIACALALEPKVLLLDEPTSQLDPVGAREILNVISNLKTTHGLTVVLIEHRLETTLQLADRVIVMDKGEVRHDTTPANILKNMSILRKLGVHTPSLPELFDRLGLEERPMLADDAPPLPHVMGMNVISRSLQPSLAKGGRGIFDMSSFPLSCKDSAPALKKIVSVNKVQFAYPRSKGLVLRDVSFDICYGDRIALLGVNGAGKSTLLHLLAGTLKPCAGNICRHNSEKPSVGLVTQNPDTMLFSETVEEELKFAPMQQGRTEAQIHALTLDTLTRFSLKTLRQRAPFSLSRGERQRTAVGSVLTLDAALLLLDEPTTGQDKARMDGMMETICTDSNAILFSTHDVETAANFANKAILLNGGCISAMGPISDVLGNTDKLTQAGICLSELQRFAVKHSLPGFHIDAIVEALFA